VIEVSDRPWSGVTRASYATAAEYCAACLIDENAAGHPASKSRCKLPVYEPRQLGGRLNRNAVHAAARRLLADHRGMRAPAALKHAAAQRLLELYRVIGDPPPHALRHLVAGEPGEARQPEVAR
jgi:hypothetical protein